MSMPVKSTPTRLSDTSFVPAEPDQDIRGRKVIDANGEDVGDVHDLFVDEVEKKVRLMEIASGGFLGFGRTHVLVPVDTIVRVDKWVVYINRHRDHIASSPAYDPKLVDQKYIDELYRHYSLNPYWTDGYSYPAFPYY